MQTLDKDTAVLLGRKSLEIDEQPDEVSDDKLYVMVVIPGRGRGGEVGAREGSRCAVSLRCGV